MKRLFILLATFSLVAGTLGVASANLITNGGFESGDLTGWTATNNVHVQNIDPVLDVPGTQKVYPHEGNYMAVMATWVGALDASLSQDFNADAYNSFTLSFAYNMQAFDWTALQDRTEGDTLSISLSASAGGKTIATETINDPWEWGWGVEQESKVLGWQEFNHTFYMPDYDIGPITIGFDLDNMPDFGDWGQATAAYIDAVSVSAATVPEPATMLLLGSGLVGLAAFRRKKKK